MRWLSLSVEETTLAIILKLTIKFVFLNSYLLSMATQTAIIAPAIFFFSIALFLTVEKPCMEPEWPTALRNFLRRSLSGSVASAQHDATKLAGKVEASE
jgi:hypothetical protein